MRRDDSPALWQAHPELALAAANSFSVHMALELQRDAAVVSTEGYDVQAAHIARQIYGRPALPESGNLFDPIKIFRDAEAHRVR